MYISKALEKLFESSFMLVQLDPLFLRQEDKTMACGTRIKKGKNCGGMTFHYF